MSERDYLKGFQFPQQKSSEEIKLEEIENPIHEWEAQLPSLEGAAFDEMVKKIELYKKEHAGEIEKLKE